MGMGIAVREREGMGIDSCGKISYNTTVSVMNHDTKSVYRLECKSRAILRYVSLLSCTRVANLNKPEIRGKLSFQTVRIVFD